VVILPGSGAARSGDRAKGRAPICRSRAQTEAAGAGGFPFHHEVPFLPMTKLIRIATLTGVLAAVALPGAALAHGGSGHGRSDDSATRSQEAGDRSGDVQHDDDSTQSARRAAGEDRAGDRRAARADRPRHTEFRGTVKAVDAAEKTVTVTIRRASRGHRALRGKDVVFTVATARLQVADRNADGACDLADVAAGDRVRVVARVSRRQISDGLTTVTAPRLKVLTPRTAQAAPAPAV
jgi:hypothetical protein